MPRPRRPTLPGTWLLGPSRRARWRRWALRRVTAVVCAIAAVLLLVGVVRPPPPATTEITVAARELPGGALLEATDLRTVAVVRDTSRVATVDDPAQVVGRRLASRMDRGEPVTTTRLVPRSPADGAPPGTVAAHVLIADERSLDLVSAGRRVTLFPDTGGPALARDVLVLGIDTPDRPSFTGSLPGSGSTPRGVVLALDPADLERIFAGQRPDGGAPRVIPVLTG